MLNDPNTIDKKINKFSPLGTFGDFGETTNGGEGSGNFGHAGRPGKQGGSAPSGTVPQGKDTGAEQKTVADYVHDDVRGKYSDGFDILESAKELLVDKAGDWEEISGTYEDEARKGLDLPSHDEASLSYDDVASIQERISEIISDKSLDDLQADLGATTVERALDFGLDKGGYDFAIANAELGQAGLSHDDALNDLKSFIADFGIRDSYGAVKEAEGGNMKTAWQDISYSMRDKLKDEYDYEPLNRD